MPAQAAATSGMIATLEGRSGQQNSASSRGDFIGVGCVDWVFKG
jgi:hypothetical protein